MPGMVGRRAAAEVMSRGQRGHLFSNHQVSDSSHSTQVQNVKKARVYVFGDADVAEDELEDTVFEMSELRARGKAKKQEIEMGTREESEETFFERDIKEGDTLQNLSLKYGCPVAELKRINNLIQDQEFYALKSIKIPMKRHGLLTELIEQENRNGSQLALGGIPSQDAIIHVSEANEVDSDSDSETQELLVRTLSIRDAFSHQGKEAVNFLHKMDTDIKRLVTSTNSRKDTLEEVTATLTCKSIRPLKKSVLDGADCGIQWKNIVITLVIVTVVVPLLYFLYYEHVWSSGSSDNSATTSSTGS